MGAIPKPGEQSLPQGENLLKAVLFPAWLLACFGLSQMLAELFLPEPPPLWMWGVFALLGVANSIVIIGLGILAHDAVHRVLFRDAFWNELIGGLLSALALIPFYANRQFHLTHHSYAHQPGRDPENPMHQRSFWVALTWGSVLALALQYRILLDNLCRRMNQRRYAVRVFKDLALMAAALLFYLGLVPALGIDLRYSLLPTIAVLPVVFGFRALSDHYGIPAVTRRSERAVPVLDVTESRDEPGGDGAPVSGWVIETHPWLEWIWSHVNYHEVHHRYPWVAHAHLPAVFAATRERVPYHIARGYFRNLQNLSQVPYYADGESHRNIHLFSADG